MTGGEGVFLGGTAVLEVVLGSYLVARRPRPIQALHVVRVGVFFVASFLVRLVLSRFVTSSFFYVVALAYVDLMLVLPAIGVVTLALARRAELTTVARVVAWLTLVPVPFGFYASFVEPFALRVERTHVAVAQERELDGELRIAVLADIQTRRVHDHLREAVRDALDFEPHLIVLPGDLIQAEDSVAYAEAAPEFTELLATLEAPLGVWFVIGNTDWGGLVPEVFEGTQVRILRNEWVVREHEGRRVVIGGSAMNWRDVETRAFVGELEGLGEAETGGEDVRLLVSHYPDVLHHLSENSRIDLLVAGHTHGGQVQVPFFGPPITLSSVPRRVAAGGLNEVDGNRIYLSRGLGWEGGAAPRIRFLAPPELSLLTLRRE